MSIVMQNQIDPASPDPIENDAVHRAEKLSSLQERIGRLKEKTDALQTHFEQHPDTDEPLPKSAP
jgi:hypothetical protein